MCGVAGFIDLSARMGAQELEATALRMADKLAHRGPDDRGSWVDGDVGVALGHRRLSIIDLSPLGRQPMESVCGRYVIAFNGEIYNFRELSRELEARGHAFRGGSDTEVMLAAFTHWGVRQALGRFNGMFAFALWDRKARLLHLARDPMGKKPMYYGMAGRTFVFGSELKALRANRAFKGEINRSAAALYLQYGYIPAPYSIYQDVFKLPPATLLTLTLGDERPSPETCVYWSLKDAAEGGLTDPFTGADEEAIRCLDDILRDAVRLRMISDVPLGAFLSGGVDSSTVVALMQAQSSRPVRTFAIGFHESGHDEAKDAEAVAKWLGTDHTQLYVSPDEAMAVIPGLSLVFDEPFADSSQIPTLLVSQLARRHVTVVLSGDGGDELFGGYNRHSWGPTVWKIASRTPRLARLLGAAALKIPSQQSWDAAFSMIGALLPKRLRLRRPGEKLHKLAESLSADGAHAMYTAMISQWQHSTIVVSGTHRPPVSVADPVQWPSLPDFRLQLMYLDTLGYLPDDILVKVDRASMAVGLEARAPLLDRRIVEFAWRLPLSIRMHDHRGKWILRQVLNKYLPSKLVERPKSGFAVPIGDWLRGRLRDWAEALLNQRRLQDDGLLRPEAIRKTWAEHLSGRRNWQHHLWTVLMLQAWLDEKRN